MAIELRQLAGNTASLDNSSCKVTLSTATRQGSLIVVVAGARPPGTSNPFTSDPSGFTRILARRSDNTGDDVAVAMWYRENASPISSVTVSATHLSLQVRVLEFTGAAQSGALDKITSAGGDDNDFASGSTGNITQADSVLVGAVVNQYASTTQFGFTGGLARLSDTTSPSSDLDHERNRLTIHAALTSTIGSYALGGQLSASRDWAVALVAFKGGSLGPARMTSKTQTPSIRIGGRGRLNAFGPMRLMTQPPAISISGRAWVGPFENQFLLGGRGGLLIGTSTDYRVESVEGLGGWDIRTSDTPFPRGDGDQRGVDLQSARQVLFRINFDGPPAQLEAAMQDLLSVLRPRREADWDLYFRLPGMPLQVLHCRPVSLNRELSLEQMLVINQAFALRAADPRIYSARWQEVVVPVSPSDTTLVTAVSASNVGNANAYPIIQVTNSSSVEVTGLELVNITGNSSFGFAGILPVGGTLVADMPAVVTSEPRSKITIDGQTKYGSWVAPRDPFFLSPDPDAPNGTNAVYLRTTPSNTPVTCTLRYRDCSSG